MAVDIFLKVDGIKGESLDAKHKDEIDVLSWNWGLSEAGPEDRGTEVVTLGFRRVGLDYVEQKIDGSALATISFGWDVSKNVKT